MEESREITLLGVFDCIFDPPYSFGPADSEWHGVGFIAHCEKTESGDLIGNGVDILGGSSFSNISFTDESPSGLRLRFSKTYNPSARGSLHPITYELSSPHGWQKQYPQNVYDGRVYAIFDGMYATDGFVMLVALNYHPHKFIWHEELRKVLALRGKINEAGQQLLEILRLSRTP